MGVPTKDENRKLIAEALAEQQGKLSPDQFDKLVDEINEVNLSFLERKAQLAALPVGTLDGNAAERRALEREEAMKWVIIKQKYGI